MTRILSTLLASTLLIAAPAFAEDKGKATKEEMKPDGTKVKTDKKKDWSDDGTGKAKTEVTTESPDGTTTTKTTKVKKSKNMDGTVDTKTSTETETKK